MDIETRKALEGSIAKWQGIVDGTVRDMGASNCPLCEKFAKDVPGFLRCLGCPVREKTGRASCAGTPYYEYAWKRSKTAARRMRDFLKELLP